MKQTTFLRLVFIAVFAIIMLQGLILYVLFNKGAGKPYISLPEEIEAAQPGDLLKVEHVSADTIEIGFYQTNN